jgi:hypothetical protein
MYYAARYSCHGLVLLRILLISKPFGQRNGSTQGALKSQKRIVSPPKITSPLGERIKYLPRPVGHYAKVTFAFSRWSPNKRI